MPSKCKREGMCNCPVGAIYRDLEKNFGKKSNFLNHITQSRIEVLKAIRSLVDERIENLDKRKSQTGSKKMKNIRVQ